MFSFYGRISRSRYWLVFGIVFVVSIVLSGVNAMMMFRGLSTGQDAGVNPYTTVSTLLSLPLIVIGVLNTIKRLHDRDKSGWWVLISLVPIIGSLWLLIECGFLKGTDGENRFGADPLLADTSAEMTPAATQSAEVVQSTEEAPAQPVADTVVVQTTEAPAAEEQPQTSAQVAV